MRVLARKIVASCSLHQISLFMPVLRWLLFHQIYGTRLVEYCRDQRITCFEVRSRFLLHRRWPGREAQRNLLLHSHKVSLACRLLDIEVLAIEMVRKHFVM